MTTHNTTTKTAGTPGWRRTLEDSVTALRDAAREYQAAARLASSGAWHCHWERLRPVDGTVTHPGYTSTIPLRPHDDAVSVIHRVWDKAADHLSQGYEAAALAYAWGATWAVRELLDGRTPDQVCFPGLENGRLVHDPLPDVEHAGLAKLARWSDAARWNGARDALDACLYAAGHAAALADQDYLADHEASQMHDALDVARGTADAAYAYGLLTEQGALQFVLNVIVRGGGR